MIIIFYIFQLKIWDTTFETFEIYSKFTTIPHIFQKFKRK